MSRRSHVETKHRKKYRIVELTYLHGKRVFVVQVHRKFLWWSGWVTCNMSGLEDCSFPLTFDDLESAKECVRALEDHVVKEEVHAI